jgi:hypothetical protein
MFVTNKRINLPKEIAVCKDINGTDIQVSVVNSFKLLGVTIDNKLNFSDHVSIVKKIVNRKLFSIKRLFYLCTSVKIHFFKTFILPYFDYCLSLVIYFPPSTFQSLNNCFNLCLYRLFKFKPDFTTEDVVDEEKSMSEFIAKLQAYDLFTLQSRLYFKLLTFAHGIKSNKNSPIELKTNLNLDSIPSETVNEEASVQIIDGSSEVLPIIPEEDYINLRTGKKARQKFSETKFETLTFKHFFPKLLRTFSYFDYSLRGESFKTQINFNINDSLKTFLVKFPKFNVNYSTFCFKNKKKKQTKSKKNR